jgi:hypothetical protein
LIFFQPFEIIICFTCQSRIPHGQDGFAYSSCKDIYFPVRYLQSVAVSPDSYRDRPGMRHNGYGLDVAVFENRQPVTAAEFMTTRPEKKMTARTI